MPLPVYSPRGEAREARRKTLHDIMELAAKFFEATLASRNGAAAAAISPTAALSCGDATEIPPRLCDRPSNTR